MTKEEWIKKFEDFNVWGYYQTDRLDNRFIELVALAKECEKELNIDLFSKAYFDAVYRGDNNEIEELIRDMLDKDADWREIRNLLAETEEMRKVFILSDDGFLVRVFNTDLRDFHRHILNTLKEKK